MKGRELKLTFVGVVLGLCLRAAPAAAQVCVDDRGGIITGAICASAPACHFKLVNARCVDPAGAVGTCRQFAAPVNPEITSGVCCSCFVPPRPPAHVVHQPHAPRQLHAATPTALAPTPSPTPTETPVEVSTQLVHQPHQPKAPHKPHAGRAPTPASTPTPLGCGGGAGDPCCTCQTRRNCPNQGPRDATNPCGRANGNPTVVGEQGACTGTSLCMMNNGPGTACVCDGPLGCNGGGNECDSHNEGWRCDVNGGNNSACFVNPIW